MGKTMESAFTVFLCSTQSDLTLEREAVLGAIAQLKLNHRSMEYFGAHADTPIVVCLEHVRACDILVLIVGHRYGSIAPELGISFSQAEYEEAYTKGKPCLVYLRSEDEPVLLKHVERDPLKVGLLETWRATLNTRHTTATFRNATDLASQVKRDLDHILQTASGETAPDPGSAAPISKSAAAHAVFQHSFEEWKKHQKLLDYGDACFLARARATITDDHKPFVFDSLVALLKPKVHRMDDILDRLQGAEFEDETPPILEECAPLIGWALSCGLSDQLDALYQAISASTDYIGKAIIRDLEKWAFHYLATTRVSQEADTEM